MERLNEFSSNVYVIPTVGLKAGCGKWRRLDDGPNVPSKGLEPQHLVKV